MGRLRSQSVLALAKKSDSAQQVIQETPTTSEPTNGLDARVGIHAPPPAPGRISPKQSRRRSKRLLEKQKAYDVKLTAARIAAIASQDAPPPPPPHVPAAPSADGPNAPPAGAPGGHSIPPQRPKPPSKAAPVPKKPHQRSHMEPHADGPSLGDIRLAPPTQTPPSHAHCANSLVRDGRCHCPLYDPNLPPHATKRCFNRDYRGRGVKRGGYTKHMQRHLLELDNTSDEFHLCVRAVETVLQKHVCRGETCSLIFIHGNFTDPENPYCWGCKPERAANARCEQDLNQDEVDVFLSVIAENRKTQVLTVRSVPKSLRSKWEKVVRQHWLR